MFDTLFHYPRVLARHVDGPSSSDRERFLAHCASGGAAHSTLLGLAPELLVVARRIALDDDRSISLTEVEMAADRWVRYQRRHHRNHGGRFSRDRFIQTASAWLRFLGRLQEPQTEPPAFAELVQAFDSYLRKLRRTPLTEQSLPDEVEQLLLLLAGLSQE